MDVYVVEPAEDGTGIQLRAGDTFTIPSGWLTMSLDPSKSRGKFFRPGVTWFVTQLLAGGIPTDPNDLGDLLDRYHKEADDLLENSSRLAHLDLETEDGAKAAMEMLAKDRDSVEFWAMAMGSMVAGIRGYLDAGDTAAAVLSAIRMQAAHSMLVFKRQLEEHVWMGYRHTQLIYDVAAAGARTVQEADVIRALRPAFERLDEDVLHAWVNSGVEIGARLGVIQVEEKLLRALAEFHLASFERKREEDKLRAETRSRVWANRFQGAVAVAALVTALAGLLALLRGLGVL